MTVYYTNQDAHDDITEQFTEFKRFRTDRTSRIDFSERLTERYLAVNDKIPPVEVLNRLTALILQNELTDKHPDKMTREEYPIMSETQEEVRKGKYKPHDDLQYEDRRFNGRVKTSFTDDYGAPQVRCNRLLGVRDGEIDRVISYLDLYDALDNAGLTERQREAIELVYFEKMTQEDAGIAMGVRKHTVNEHLEIALRKLRNYLTENTELFAV